MYIVVAFLTNLYKRLRPNYKRYFEYSLLAEIAEQSAVRLTEKFEEWASCKERGDLLPEHKKAIASMYLKRDLFDAMARDTMSRVTAEQLKSPQKLKIVRLPYNMEVLGS